MNAKVKVDDLWTLLESGPESVLADDGGRVSIVAADDAHQRGLRVFATRPELSEFVGPLDDDLDGALVSQFWRNLDREDRARADGEQ